MPLIMKKTQTLMFEQVSWKKMPQTFGENYLALTGPLPEVTSWSAAVTGPLTDSVEQWRPCEPCSWR